MAKNTNGRDDITTDWGIIMEDFDRLEDEWKKTCHCVLVEVVEIKTNGRATLRCKSCGRLEEVTTKGV